MEEIKSKTLEKIFNIICNELSSLENELMSLRNENKALRKN